MTPKLNFDSKYFNFWSHHRNDWRRIYNSLSPLHTTDGVVFSNSFEEFVMFSPCDDEFVAISHRVPKHPVGIASKYEQNHDLEAVLSSDQWQHKRRKCRGIITFSEYAASYIRSRVDMPVLALPHPFETERPRFGVNNDVLLFTGHWMRDFKAFFDLKVPAHKVLLDCMSDMWDGSTQEFEAEIAPFRNDTVEIRKYVEDSEYDRLMRSSIVFLWLHDVSACNTILDCIASRTPLIVNRLPAVEEYLGDYPLICDSLDEVPAKLQQLETAVEHLERIDKTRFTYEAFVDGLVSSDLYGAL